MGEFIVYSVKVSLCLVMFYVFYKLLLSRTTLHTFNRFVILALVVMSLVLPFVHLTVKEPVMEGTVMIDQMLMMATVVEEAQPTFHLSLINVLVLIYIIGVAGFFINMLFSYFGIHRIMKKASRVVDGDEIRIYVVDDDIAPFSWFRNIVISTADYCDHRSAIITHEKAHVAKRHSADILLCNILTVVQWFNPAAWLLKTELQEVHEYEADEAVLNSGIDATGYQLLLVRKAVGDRLFAIANNLNKNSLKKRITMMKTKKTNRWACMKALVMLPLTAVAVVAFASPEMAEVENEVIAESQQLVQAVEQQVAGQTETMVISGKDVVMPVSAKVEEVAPADTAKSGKVFDVVEEMPSFPGGTRKMMEYVASNIKYPQEAQKSNQQGRVIVAFVVRSNGTVDDIHVVRSVSPILDAEAMRVVKGMPQWTPGKQGGKPVNVKFVIPVSFSLNQVAPKETPATGGKEAPTSVSEIKVVGYGTVEKSNGGSLSVSDKEQTPHYYGSISYNPLIIIDGKKLSETKYKDLNSINPDEIERIDVLKDDSAVKQYGEEGKNGVIIITMKKK